MMFSRARCFTNVVGVERKDNVIKLHANSHFVVDIYLVGFGGCVVYRTVIEQDAPRIDPLQ